MFDDEGSAWLEDDAPPNRRPGFDEMVGFTREAFRQEGSVTRGQFLRHFRGPNTVEMHRDMFRGIVAGNPHVSPGETIEFARGRTLGFYEAVAEAAGLDDLEKASLLVAIRRGLDLATADH